MPEISTHHFGIHIGNPKSSRFLYVDFHLGIHKLILTTAADSGINNIHNSFSLCRSFGKPVI